MKRKPVSQSAFFYVKASIGLVLLLVGISLAVMGLGQFSAEAKTNPINGKSFPNALVPAMFDCAQLHSLNVHIQENFRAGAMMTYCGESQGGSLNPDSGESMSLAQEILAPLLGGTDADLITGADSGTHIIQSETYASANPDNPNEIVVAYNDSRGVASSPINISSASVSTDGGATFTRLTRSNGQSPFGNTLGDPVVLYNRPTGTWFTIWLDLGCGGQGLGGYKSTNPSDPDSWTHFCVHTGSSDDRESGWADNNPSSPFYGKMYISWNDFTAGGSLKVRSSTDNGATWGNEKVLNAAFIRDVQITGDLATGDVYVAGMDEGGGGSANRTNKMFRSTDGGATFTQTYSGPSFAAPGSTVCASNSYFYCMFSGPSFWRHMGWGQPAALNNVVHYVYDSKNGSDTGNVFYIRSTDKGQTFSAPLQLNTDATTRPQWQPNISVSDDNTLVATWYDARESSNCVKGDENTPCYRMWARKSTDNGATWASDEAFSDVVSPLPGQSDSSIVTEYAGDYDYSSAITGQHNKAWTDGRVVVNSASQQDAFFDKEGGGGGGNNIVLQARVKTHDANHNVELKWAPADGGAITVMRNGSSIGITSDDGSAKDKLGSQTGTFTYQVCETDSGDCSNEVEVQVQ